MFFDEVIIMRRKIDKVLDNWLSERKQAILLFGARQIGKTYSIRECLKRNKRPFVELNFSTDPTSLNLFSKLTNPEDFYMKLSLVSHSTLTPNKTCIFLDEIQEIYKYRKELQKSNPELYYKTIDPITLIKALVDEGRFRYVLSGSLLGINLSEIRSNPLGYLDVCTMYPMDFEEFLWAKGIGEEAISYLKKQLKTLTPVEETIHAKIMDALQQYLLVGGMPESVATYVKTSDLTKVRETQKQIFLGYEKDIQKYAPDKIKVLISESFKSIPSELNRKDKHFRKYKLEYQNSKNLDMTDIFLWLTNAGVALPTYNVSEPVYPLKLNEDRKTLKLFSNDIGLLSYQLFDKEGAIKFIQGDWSINYGAPFENVVAEELVSKGYPLFYFNSKKHGEIDFLIQIRGKIIPLEVKSGSPNKCGAYSHPALDDLLNTYKEIDKAFIISKNNIYRENDKVVNIPAYMLAFFPEADL